MSTMRVRVDPGICQGHGICFGISDSLYDIRDSDGRAIVRLDPVPEHLQDAARQSVEGCPERAITIVEQA